MSDKGLGTNLKIEMHQNETHHFNNRYGYACILKYLKLLRICYAQVAFVRSE